MANYETTCLPHTRPSLVADLSFPTVLHAKGTRSLAVTCHSSGYLTRREREPALPGTTCSVWRPGYWHSPYNHISPLSPALMARLGPVIVITCCFWALTVVPFSAAYPQNASDQSAAYIRDWALAKSSLLSMLIRAEAPLGWESHPSTR